MTDLRTALNTAAQQLTAAGIADARIDAELLAAHVLGMGRGELQAAELGGRELDAAQQAAFEAAVQRRAGREPLQHITGLAPFRYLELEVGPGVFVPRPETEMLAQIAVDALLASPAPVAVDLGTGSGAIALAMATEAPHAQVYAVERSPEAHAWAKRNIDRLSDGNLQLRLGDFATALDDLAGTVSVVATNPPYVPQDAIPRDPEVRLFDPVAALYSGEDGLDDIRNLAIIGMRLAHPGGIIAIEHGEWQGQGVRRILEAAGWVSTATHEDLTRRDRVTTALRP